MQSEKQFRYWLFSPTLFTIGVWMILFYEEHLFNLIPSIIKLEQPIISYERLSKIYGLMTVLNIAIVTSATFIVIFLRNVLAIVAKPLLIILGITIETILGFLYQHSNIIEATMYFICYFFVVQGAKNGKENGMYIALIGLLIFVILLSYANGAHDKQSADFLPEYQMLLFLTLIPLTIYFDSYLFGFLCVGTFYWLFGFRYKLFGLTRYIGFEDDVAIDRIAVISFSLVLIFTFIKSFYDIFYLNTFVFPVQTCGLITYFLTVLITSSLLAINKERSYASHQIIPIISFVIMFFIGGATNTPTIINITAVFLFLWLEEKVFDIIYWRSDSAILAIFINSVIIFVTSLYLKSHPEYLEKVREFFSF